MNHQKTVEVLIVEDRQLTSQTIEELLKSTGYTVVGKAANGLEGVEKTQATRPDVVLMDLSGLDGIEATRLIQERCPTPVVVLAAHDTPELVQSASEAGAGAYLVKPASSSEMERAITIAMTRFDDMLALRRLNAELRADITARKKAEAALLDVEVRHRTLLDQLPAVVYTVEFDKVSKTTYIGPQVESLLGFSQAEWLADPDFWIKQLHPDDRDSVLSEVERTDASGEPFDMEYRVLTRDGRVLWFRNRNAQMRDKAGRTRYSRGVLLDVTRHKQTEDALRQRISALALLSDVGKQVASLLDLDSLLDRAARLVQESFGYHHVGLFTLDRERGEMVMRAMAGDFTSVTPVGHRITLDQGMVGWVGHHGETLLANDVQADPRYASVLPSVPIRSELSIPIRAAEEIVGVLDIQSPQIDAFGEDDVMVLETLADQIAVAIENAKAYQATQCELDDRRRAEQELQQSIGRQEIQQQFINSIVDSIPSSLLVIDRNLRIVSVNRNFVEKARRSAAGTLGLRIDEVFPSVLIDHTHLEKKVQEVFRSAQPLEGGKVAYRAPGVPTRIYYYRFIPLSAVEAPGKEVNNVMLLMDDITEREQLGEEVQRAELHLASVVECANDLVVSLDRGGRIVTWNQAAERISGFSVEQVKGRPLLSLCAIEHGPIMTDMLQRLTRGEQVQNTEINLVMASGRQVQIAWSCSSMRDDAGKATGIVAVGRDLTERRQLEAQLIQSTKMASLGVMAGGIAHEVRNPLGIISAASQLLLERPDDVQLRSECAQKIYSATQRASSIIESLMKFAQPQVEPMAKIDLNASLEDILSLMSNQLRVQQVALVKEIQENLPRVYGHPNLLQQVFSNLILNSCNAMPEGGTLTVACLPAETGTIEVRFSDTGHGILPEHQPKIFDPFFTTMPVGKGTGLGLSISYSIIQQHGGSITVNSQMGLGTTFIIRLPAAT
jgi:PAS domain S-box-containing protein